jgi:hypothetical protein
VASVEGELRKGIIGRKDQNGSCSRRPQKVKALHREGFLNVNRRLRVRRVIKRFDEVFGEVRWR